MGKYIVKPNTNLEDIVLEELCVGNYVMLHDYEIYMVESIHIGGVVSLINDRNGIDEIMYDRCHPIPLTDKLLLKLGFQRHVLNRCFKKGNIEIIHDNILGFGFLFSFLGYTYPHIIPPYFKYLHQLQNIYRLITKKELEVNF